MMRWRLVWLSGLPFLTPAMQPTGVDYIVEHAPQASCESLQRLRRIDSRPFVPEQFRVDIRGHPLRHPRGLSWCLFGAALSFPLSPRSAVLVYFGHTGPYSDIMFGGVVSATSLPIRRGMLQACPASVSSLEILARFSGQPS